MSSTLAAVAAKDVADAGRSKLLWAIVGLLVSLSAIGYVAVWATGDATAAEMLALLGLPLIVVLPIAALVVGYTAVVGERRSGSIKLLLGLPPNRTDVVFGKLLGRMAVVAVAVVLAFLVALALGAALFGGVPFADWLAFGAITLLFGLSFVGLAVGVSAAVSSRGRSMAAVVGLYVAFVALWELLTAGPYYLLHGETPPVAAETWYLAVQQLNPIQAYATVSTAAIEGEVVPFQFQYGLETPEGMLATPAERYVGEAPVYLHDWFGVVALLLWIVVPVGIGYYRFQRADL